MTQLFLNPLTKFTSDNITALPGARLYFYQNNSSTPKAVYADKNKVTSLGVYVQADSAGIFEPIWLDGTYRATLKYSANWTSDPVGVVQTGWPVDDVGDIGNFAAFAAWDSTFTYDITTNTFVTGPDGLYYKSIQNPNLNKTPASNPAHWEQMRFQSVWNTSRSYVENDIVEWEGKLYSAKNIVNVNHEPPNSTYWNDLTFNNNVVGNLDITGSLTVDVDADIAGEATVGSMTCTAGATVGGGLSVTGSVQTDVGVVFPNSNSVSATVLDYYEESTFTPVLVGTSTAGTGTYTAQVGRQTRIGNIVFVSIELAWTAHTGTGNMQITGLSYTSLSALRQAFMMNYSEINIGGNIYQGGAQVGLSANAISLVRSLNDGSGVITSIPIDTVGSVQVSGFYFV